MARREAWLLQPGSRMPHSDRISKLSREGEEERLELAQDLASVRAKADSWKRRAAVMSGSAKRRISAKSPYNSM